MGTLLLHRAGKGTIAAGGGDAAWTTAFLARTTGLDATHTNAYKTMLNGMASAGLDTKLDVYAVFNTQDAATSLLNIPGAAFNFTNVGTLAFTADHGYAATSTTARLTTPYASNAGGNKYTETSAAMGIWSKTSGQVTLAAWGNYNDEYIICRFSDDQSYCVANNLNFDATVAANTDGSGMIAWTRTGTTTQLSRNGSAIGSAGVVSFTQAVNSTAWSVGSTADNGIAPAMCFAGSFLSPTDISNLFTYYSGWNTTISGGNP